MAVYNCAEYLKQSIQSILDQTMGDFEFIIIDDHSDDSVADVLYDFRDPRIKTFRMDSNIGLTRCLNIALEKSKGYAFARHDGDDIALPERFELELPLLANRTGLVSCWAEAIDANGKKVVDYWMQDDLQQSVEQIEQLAPVKNCILSPGTMFTRDVFNRIGYYDPAVRYAQDYNYWLRLYKEFAIDIVPEILVQKRVHARSVWSLRHDADWQEIARNRAVEYPRIFTPNGLI
jgi:glycosyltransferase involved in cell wall biosynthesis